MPLPLGLDSPEGFSGTLGPGISWPHLPSAFCPSTTPPITVIAPARLSRSLIQAFGPKGPALQLGGAWGVGMSQGRERGLRRLGNRLGFRMRREVGTDQGEVKRRGRVGFGASVAARSRVKLLGPGPPKDCSQRGAGPEPILALPPHSCLCPAAPTFPVHSFASALIPQFSASLPLLSFLPAWGPSLERLSFQPPLPNSLCPGCSDSLPLSPFSGFPCLSLRVLFFPKDSLISHLFSRLSLVSVPIYLWVGVASCFSLPPPNISPSPCSPPTPCTSSISWSL